MKYFLLFILSYCTLFASTDAINKKIILNKKILTSKNKQQKKAQNKVNVLSKHIKTQEKSYAKIEYDLSKVASGILLNKLKLKNSKQKVIKLELEANELKEKVRVVEEQLVEQITNKYSASLGVNLAKKKTKQEIIEKEIYNLLLDDARETTLKLNLDYLKLTSNQRRIEKETKELAIYIKKQEKQKEKYLSLKKKKKVSIKKLAYKHNIYQKQLKKIIKKQDKLQDLLSSLNILKKKEITKERKKAQKLKKARLAKKRKEEAAARAKAKREKIVNKEMKISRKQLDKEINMEVRNIGSSSKGVKISKYRGKKTISPLKSYTITKKFGKYYDPVYKIKLFNEALSMKPKKPNSKVYSIFKGKIVYAKKNSGTLENVVIVQHKGGLHTIYSHLDKLAPNLRVGKWIKKGSVVGRVSNTLMFQATKNSKYINPRELFR